MADAPKVVTYDLTRDVPSGITLVGLSEPKFDGGNYFRQPLGQKSEITFQTDKSGFAQLEYQLFSPSAVTEITKLDGKELGSRIFPAGKFVENAVVGDFIQPGKHTFAIEYHCEPKCDKLPSQYWTKVSIVDQGIPQARQDVGLKVVRLNQYAPASELQLEGVGSLRFDGVNFYRPVEKSALSLSWPNNIKPLEVDFQLLGSQNFRVVASQNGEVVDTGNGSSKKDVFLHVNLRNKKLTDKLSIEIKCLDNPSIPCTNLYFPSVIAQENLGSWAGSVVLSLGISLLMLIALAGFLFPKRQLA